MIPKARIEELRAMLPQNASDNQLAHRQVGSWFSAEPEDSRESFTLLELRALLDAYEARERVCEWKSEDWANFKGAQRRTSCGMVIHDHHDTSRPCWCSGRVVVKEG